MKFIEVIILPIAIIAVIAIGLWFIKPAYNEIKILIQEIETKQNTLDEKQKLVVDIKKLISQYEDVKGKVNKVFYVLPNEAEIPNILVQLEALASENGIIFESINFGEIQQSEQEKITFKEETSLSPEEQGKEQENSKVVDRRKSISVDVKLIGSYENFKNYLKSLENNIRIMDIISINFSGISGEEKGENLNNFSYLVKLKVYYQ